MEKRLNSNGLLTLQRECQRILTHPVSEATGKVAQYLETTQICTSQVTRKTVRCGCVELQYFISPSHIYSFYRKHGGHPSCLPIVSRLARRLWALLGDKVQDFSNLMNLPASRCEAATHLTGLALEYLQGWTVWQEEAWTPLCPSLTLTCFLFLWEWAKTVTVIKCCSNNHTAWYAISTLYDMAKVKLSWVPLTKSKESFRC